MNGARRALPLAAFIAACLLVAVFVVRLAQSAFDPADGEPFRVEGWMTVGYVARTTDVPRDVLAEAIGIEEGSARGHNISDIAAARGEPADALISRLEAAIASHRGAGGD